MLRKGFTKCITFVLAAAFLLSSVAAVPAMAGELEENEIDSQVQSNNTEAVEDERKNTKTRKKDDTEREACTNDTKVRTNASHEKPQRKRCTLKAYTSKIN